MRAAGAIVAADGGGGGGGGLLSVNGDFGPNAVLDASDVGALPIAGGTMTGDIDMGGGSVVNERIVSVETAISATTASLGLADRYIATASPVTITISTSDIVDNNRFVIAVRTASVSVGTPVTIATEGGELIDGVASIPLDTDYDSVTLVARGGNLESEQ